MLFPVIGLLIGVAIGVGSGMVFPLGYSAYVAIGILACLDSVLGGIAGNLLGRFQAKVFVTGLFCNGLFAMALIWLGAKLSIDFSLAAVVVYGSRMFQNFSRIRLFLLNKEKKGIMIDAD